MGQSHGKFSIPHSSTTPAKDEPVNPVQNGKDTANSDVMNGTSHVTAEIPPITETESSEHAKVTEETSADPKVPNGDLQHDTLLKKYKKRAASWKSKFLHSPASKQSSGEAVQSTDENNNIESSAEPTCDESTQKTGENQNETSPTESKTKKAKRSISSLMKRASSLTSKKNKPDKNNNVENVEETKTEEKSPVAEEQSVKSEKVEEEPAPVNSEATDSYGVPETHHVMSQTTLLETNLKKAELIGKNERDGGKGTSKPVGERCNRKGNDRPKRDSKHRKPHGKKCESRRSHNKRTGQPQG